MNPRERIEEREYDVLSPRAFHVKEAKRAHAAAQDPLRKGRIFLMLGIGG